MNKKLIFKNDNYKIELFKLYENEKRKYEYYNIKIFYKNELIKEYWDEPNFYFENDNKTNLKDFINYFLQSEINDIIKKYSYNFYYYGYKYYRNLCEYIRKKSDLYKYNYILQNFTI